MKTNTLILLVLVTGTSLALPPMYGCGSDWLYYSGTRADGRNAAALAAQQRTEQETRRALQDAADTYRAHMMNEKLDKSVRADAKCKLKSLERNPLFK